MNSTAAPGSEPGGEDDVKKALLTRKASKARFDSNEHESAVDRVQSAIESSFPQLVILSTDRTERNRTVLKYNGCEVLDLSKLLDVVREASKPCPCAVTGHAVRQNNGEGGYNSGYSLPGQIHVSIHAIPLSSWMPIAATSVTVLLLAILWSQSQTLYDHFQAFKVTAATTTPVIPGPAYGAVPVPMRVNADAIPPFNDKIRFEEDSEAGEEREHLRSIVKPLMDPPVIQTPPPPSPPPVQSSPTIPPAAAASITAKKIPQPEQEGWFSWLFA